MTNHCAICNGSWDAETGAVVGHPVEHRICADCFDSGIAPLLRAHDAPAARPTEAPCLVTWSDGYGVPIPPQNDLGGC